MSENAKIEFLGENDKAGAVVESFEYSLETSASGKPSETTISIRARVKHTLTFGKQKVFVRNTFVVEKYNYEEYLRRSLVKQPPLITFQGKAAKAFKDGTPMRQVIAEHDGQTVVYAAPRSAAIRKPPTKEEAIAAIIASGDKGAIEELLRAAKAAGMDV